MKLIIEETEKEMSESAMHILLGAMMQDKRVNISLTAGESPKTLYKMMAPIIKDKEQFKNVQYYLFDEAPYKDKPYGQTGMKCMNYFSMMLIFQMKEFIQLQWKIGKNTIGKFVKLEN